MFHLTILLIAVSATLAFPAEYVMNEEYLPEEVYEMVAMPAAYRYRRDLTGNSVPLPDGGRVDSATLSGGPLAASVAQSFDRHGKPGPQVFTGQVDLRNENQHGVSLGGSKIPSTGMKSVFAEGRAPIINTPDHKLDAIARHENYFGRTGQRLGERNTGGLTYRHKSGFGAFGNVVHVPGFRNDRQFGFSFTTPW